MTPRLVLVAPALSPAEAGAAAARLGAACAAGDVASLILRLTDADERSLVAALKAVAPGVQAAGTALLVQDRFEIVARGGADGVHVASAARLDEALEALRPHDRIVGRGRLRTRHDAMEAGEAGVDYVMFGPDRAADGPPSTGEADTALPGGGATRHAVGGGDAGDAPEEEAGPAGRSDDDAGSGLDGPIDPDADAAEALRPMTALELAAWWADTFEIPCLAAVRATTPADAEAEARRAAQTGAEFVALSLDTIGGDPAALVAAAMRGLGAASD